MSLTEVHAAYGAPALLRLLLGVTGYLLLHLLRVPLLLATRVLDAAVRRMDTLARPPAAPLRPTPPNPEAL